MFICLYPNRVKYGKASESDLANPFSHPVVKKFVSTMRTQGPEAARKGVRQALVSGTGEENQRLDD